MSMSPNKSLRLQDTPTLIVVHTIGLTNLQKDAGHRIMVCNVQPNTMTLQDLPTMKKEFISGSTSALQQPEQACAQKLLSAWVSTHYGCVTAGPL